MITKERIEQAYEDLRAAKTSLHGATEHEIAVKAELDDKRLMALANGTITGKNETEREAKAREMFGPDYLELTRAQRNARNARLTYDLAQIEVEALRMRLRLAELMVYNDDDIPFAEDV